MATDYIPSADAELSAWLDNFVKYANANLASLGLVAADVTPMQDALTNWDSKYADLVSAQAAAQGARQAKEEARRSAESIARSLAQRLQANPNVQNSDRQSLGMNVRSTSRTAAAAPTSRPVATVDTRQRLQHTISFGDENTPGSRAKPAGVTGCEIWMKIGTAPTDPSELSYLAMDTRSPYTAMFDGADAGKTVHYMLRWVNSRSERGPWSQTVSATITA